MYFNMKESTGLINPDINMVFDDSIYAVDTDKEFTFEGSNLFNSPVTFPSYAESMKIIGLNYNCPISFPSNIKNISNMVSGCPNFNQPVTIPNTVTNMVSAFQSCTLFNQPINIPDSATNIVNLFRACSNFNEAISFGNSNPNCGYMFYGSKYNRTTTLPSSLKDASYMFYGLSQFNAEVTFNGQTRLTSIFNGCGNFNQPITIPDECERIDCMVAYDINFNSPITFGNGGNLSHINGFAINSFLFNQPLIIPNGVTNCEMVLEYCTSYNSVVVIPETVKSTYYMFGFINSAPYNVQNGRFAPVDYKALKQPIYFFANNIQESRYMFTQCNTMSDLYLIGLQNNIQLAYFMRNNGVNRCNIYTDDVSQNYIYNTAQILTNGGKPTWTNDVANGCIYNTVVNLYVYNNWDGTIPEI